MFFFSMNNKSVVFTEKWNYIFIILLHIYSFVELLEHATDESAINCWSLNEY